MAVVSDARKARRESGSFYTPPRLARHVVENAVSLWRRSHPNASLNEARILDPACGDGVFLREAVRLNLPHLYGVDIDPLAVAAARSTVFMSYNAVHAAAKKRRTPTFSTRLLEARIIEGNAILGAGFSPPPPKSVRSEDPKKRFKWRQFDWRQAFPEVFAGPEGGFDLIVGNPPYVGIRRISQGPLAAAKPYWSRNYQTARGAYDLYVLFLEQANRLLQPGGVCAMITPNKVGSLLYAQACRDLLLQETCLERIDDCSNLKLFPGVSVYPYVLYWRKEAPSKEQRVMIYEASAVGELPTNKRCDAAQAAMRAKGVFVLHTENDLEQRVATMPLAELATLHCGATGFQASQISEALGEAAGNERSQHSHGAAVAGWDFIVSGSIDRYRIRKGGVRFLKKRYVMPLLPFDAPTVSERKRNLFDNPKIVVSGLTKRLETAWCESPLALGVQVFAVSQCQADPFYLLGLLNSKLLTFLFRQRHASKRLAEGYASVNKGQLGELPIRRIDFQNQQETQLHNCIAANAKILQQYGDAEETPPSNCDELEQQLDDAVYQLYQLTRNEIDRVEAMCDELA